MLCKFQRSNLGSNHYLLIICTKVKSQFSLILSSLDSLLELKICRQKCKKDRSNLSKQFKENTTLILSRFLPVKNQKRILDSPDAPNAPYGEPLVGVLKKQIVLFISSRQKLQKGAQYGSLVSFQSFTVDILQQQKTPQFLVSEVDRKCRV